MLTMSIHNTSSLPIEPESVAAAAGTYPLPSFLTLPGCLSWVTIAAGDTASYVVSVADLEAPAKGSVSFGGPRVKDVLQQMIQAGQIAVTYTKNVTGDVETYAAAVSAE